MAKLQNLNTNRQVLKVEHTEIQCIKKQEIQLKSIYILKISADVTYSFFLDNSSSFTS